MGSPHPNGMNGISEKLYPSYLGSQVELINCSTSTISKINYSISFSPLFPALLLSLSLSQQSSRLADKSIPVELFTSFSTRNGFPTCLPLCIVLCNALKILSSPHHSLRDLELTSINRSKIPPFKEKLPVGDYQDNWQAPRNAEEKDKERVERGGERGYRY